MAKTSRTRSTYVLPEPKWAEYKILTDDAERDTALQHCLYFVHYEIAEKAGIAPLKKWMKENWDKQDITSISVLPESTFYSMSKYFFCWNKLGWLPESVLNFMKKQKLVWLKQASLYIEEKKETPKVVNIRENLNKFAIAIDDSIEKIIGGTQITNYKDFVLSYNLNAAEINKAVEIVDRFAIEFKELAEGTDTDLMEGYSHVKKSTLKHLLAFFDGIVIGLSETKQVKKIVRIKRKKPVDKNKLVSKLKYTKQDVELNLTSINPVEIIGASEVWVYDVNRKRIGVYASEYANTLGVKGTAIDNYSTSKSYEKTIRAADIVKQLVDCRKNGLHTLADKIRSKKYPVKTRVQPSMILLRVIK